MEGIQYVTELEVQDQIKVGAKVLRVVHFVCHKTRTQLEALDVELEDQSVLDGSTTIEHRLPRSFTPREDGDANSIGDYITGLVHGLTPVNTEFTQDDSQAPKSAYYGHDITLNPVKADLSKKETTCMIFDYIWNVRRKIIKSWYTEYEENHGSTSSPSIDLAEPPPSSIGCFFMCDGQPAAQLSKLIASDNRRFYLGEKETPIYD